MIVKKTSIYARCKTEIGRNQFYDSNIEIICTHPDIKINIFDVARSELTI